VSNLDYIGLNATGWLKVRERHEPMHQLSMRYEFAIANMRRASSEAQGHQSALVEPQGDRSNWVRLNHGSPMPAVHVNHASGRFTSHGEVVYEQSSNGVTTHSYWGQAANWWPGQIAAITPPAGSCGSCQSDSFTTLEQWYEAAKSTPSDFHEHLDKLREYASKCDKAAEICSWGKPARVALAIGGKSLTSYSPSGPRPEWRKLAALLGDRFQGVPYEPEKVEPCDLLFLDTKHTAPEVLRQLQANSDVVSKYIVIHCTSTYGDNGDEGGPGVMHGIRQFVRLHPEWNVVYHEHHNNGLLILSRLEEDRKQLPGFVRRGVNYAKAMARFHAAGKPVVTQRVFELRMAECLTCPERAYDSCSACGCPLEDKLRLGSESCGYEKVGKPTKWDRVTDPADLVHS
jgi:hypothetical protein